MAAQQHPQQQQQQQQQQHTALAAVEQLALRVAHAGSVSEALAHYEGALDQLQKHISSLPVQSAARSQHIERFEQLLTTAERLKQPDPAAAEYCWRKDQAAHLAQQAVDADGKGHEQARQLYSKLLECLQRCHALETIPACQAAIMARFKVYLERAEQLRSHANSKQ